MKNHFARLTYKLASYGIVAFGCVTVASSQNLSPIKPQSTPLPNPSLGSEIVEITVVINGAGRVNMPGLDCQAGPVEGNKICKRKVEKGKAVTAEAVPGDGLAFTSWAGACIGSNARCIFTPTKNVTIAATFGAKPQTVNATVEIAIPAPGGGRVIPAPFAGFAMNCERKLGGAQTGTCKAVVPVGSTFKVIAQPESEIKLASWTGVPGQCQSGDSCTFVVKDSVILTPKFIVPNKTLTIKYRNEFFQYKTGKGLNLSNFVLTVEPKGIICKSSEWKTLPPTDTGYTKYQDFTCTLSQQKLSNVSIAAKGHWQNKDSNVSGKAWGGDCKGTDGGVCKLTLDTDKTVLFCRAFPDSPLNICKD